MRFCVHCGVRVGDAAEPNCPSCGAPHPGADPAGGDAGPPAAGTPGYLRVGATRLPRWLPWALVAVLVGGGTALAVQATEGPDAPTTSSPAGAEAPSATPDGSGDTYDSSGADDSSDDYSDSGDDATDDGTDDSYEDDSDTDTDSASAVVTAYYDYINEEDFSAAWDIGGSNIGGDSYSAWVDGFDSTSHIEVEVEDDGLGEVSADIRATQDDGTVATYTGTYTVENGEIVSADIDTY